MKKVVVVVVNLSMSNVNSNYFKLLGFDESFDICEKSLHQSYMKLQKLVHPDILSHKSQVDKMQGLQLSADVNQAYQTLKNPLKRAEYLLSLNNIYVGSEKNAVKAEMPLLMESMELREALASCDEMSKLVDMLEQAKSLQTESEIRFANEFSNNDLLKASQTVIRWRFIEKYIEEIKQKIKHINYTKN